MHPLCFKTAGISKLLCGLDNNKAPAPDGIYPRILRQLNLVITPHFMSSLRRHTERALFLRIGDVQIFVQFTKHEQERTQPITDQYPLHVVLVNYLSTWLLATSWDTLATAASSMRSITVSGRADPMKASCLSSHTTCSMASTTENRRT